MNTQRHSHIVHNNKIQEKILSIENWIQAVGGNNSDEVLAFVNKHFDHLNKETSKSLLKNIKNIIGFELQDPRDADLANIIEDLITLKNQRKTL